MTDPTDAQARGCTHPNRSTWEIGVTTTCPDCGAVLQRRPPQATAAELASRAWHCTACGERAPLEGACPACGIERAQESPAVARARRTIQQMQVRASRARHAADCPKCLAARALSALEAATRRVLAAAPPPQGALFEPLEAWQRARGDEYAQAAFVAQQQLESMMELESLRLCGAHRGLRGIAAARAATRKHSTRTVQSLERIIGAASGAREPPPIDVGDIAGGLRAMGGFEFGRDSDGGDES